MNFFLNQPSLDCTSLFLYSFQHQRDISFWYLRRIHLKASEYQQQQRAQWQSRPFVNNRASCKIPLTATLHNNSSPLSYRFISSTTAIAQSNRYIYGINDVLQALHTRCYFLCIVTTVRQFWCWKLKQWRWRRIWKYFT